MCGIAGLFHYRRPDRPVGRDLLVAMTRSLAHRGPDGEGIWRDAGIGLGHRRLAIIDLHERAAQPMCDAAGRFVVTFNGEIYNYRELREQLEPLGHTFQSQSDTEVILAAYHRWGVDCVDHLSGDFAFVIWDKTRRRLMLARDPMGVKPLFYADCGGTLRFGSEIKAILTDPDVDREFDPIALDAFLTFSYTPAPYTGFRHVRQLLPGYIAIVDEQGFKTRRYWHVPYQEQPTRLSFDDARDRFTELLDRVTQSQMVSDVPLGAFLSGGLDSAAIVRSMMRAKHGNVHALTVGFDVPGFDEREAARTTAQALGVEFDESEATLDAAKLLPMLSLHMEEPTADSSMLPVYLLCRDARKRFKVALAGDGADELLAGYSTYRASLLAGRYRCLPWILRRGVIAPMASCLPVSDRKYSWHAVANRFVYGAEAGPVRDHATWRVIFNSPLKKRLYARSFLRELEDADPIGLYASQASEVPETRDLVDALLHADTSFYLPNDMLAKVDRMSMACGLEVRVPFLDREMVEFCASLPAEYKLYRGRRRKHILRESLRDSIPSSVLSRPKSGFNLPIESWLRGPLRELLRDSVATERHALSEYLDLEELAHVADEHCRAEADHAHALFTVMMFSFWLKNARTEWKPVIDSRELEQPAIETA